MSPDARGKTTATTLPLDESVAAPPLTLVLSPSGHLRAEVARGVPLAPPLAPLADAFARGDGHGLFRLGAAETESALPGVLAFWRDVGRAFAVRLCASENVESLREKVHVEVPEEDLDAWASEAPPMPGGEYLTPAVLRELWARMEAAVQVELGAWEGTVEAFLKSASPAWNLVGRVCFHLAENKNDPEAPFAFLATYTTRLSAKAKAQHLPLAQALREYAGARNKAALLRLLEPVQRAARTSEVAKDLVESGAVFETLAWTPAEAHQFLGDVPAFEAAGVVVRMPAAWRAKRPARPEVQVTVGKVAGGVGADAILDFSIEVTLDGETLTKRELEEILESTEGLALVRGRWVEVDRERLRAVLDRWSRFEAEHRGSGLSVVEGLRLLAGADIGQDAGASPAAETAAWSKVVAGASLAQALAELRDPSAVEALTPGPLLEAKLRPYQELGLRWLWRLRSLGLGGCLADDMGLGKTIQIIALLVLLKQERARKGDSPGREPPSLLVVPASLIANWHAELTRFAPRLAVFIAHPSETPPPVLTSLTPEALGEHDVVITTYGTLQRVAALSACPWNVVVLDEAQAIKNPGAKQTHAVKTLRARLRLALTGTPVENRLGDLWSLFDFTCPGLLGSAKEFGRFVRAADKRAHGYGPLRELVRPYILRRLKTDKRVIADLPDKTEVRAFCSLTRKQVALYQQAVEELQTALYQSEGIKRRGVVLAALMRLKQICNHPSQWLGDGGYAPADSGKLARLAELAEEIASRQEKVLVFTQFRELTGPLAEFLGGVFGRPGLVLSGETAVKKRQSLVDDFQREEGPPFFVLSLKAGGTGLNLTAARHVIHFDRWWNPAVENQATDRAYRIGQKNGVLVHKFVCRGTIEEKIDALIASKEALSRQLLEGTDEVKLTELDDAELLRLVAIDIRSALAEG